MRTPDTEEQQVRIAFVVARTSCPVWAARAELEAEEWSITEAVRGVRHWMASQAASALSRFNAPVNDEAYPYQGS